MSVDDIDRGDHDIFNRTVTATGAGRGNRVNNALGLVVNHFTEDGVVAQQPRGRGDGDEEVGAVGAAGHRPES